MYRMFSVAVLSISLAALAYAEDDKALAEGLADVGSSFVAKNDLGRAKKNFYAALAHDENCPIALYELAKIFENEGDTVSAINFYVKAAQECNRSSNATVKAKAQDCERRVQKLSPYATQFTTLMEGYAQELGRIATKNTDAPTLAEAQNKVRTLNLMTIVAPEKIPDIIKPSNKPPAEQPKNNGRSRFPTQEDAPQVKTQVAPDVERALKADGWTDITGVWKKKAEGVYEVTDGKLECKKTNGALQVFVHKGGTGSVAVFVRASARDYSDFDTTSTSSSGMGYFGRARGFGYFIKGSDAKLYTPGMWQEGDTFMPDLERTVPLTDIPKHRVLVQVQDSKLDVTLDTNSPRHTTYKIPKDGPFLIEIKGTMTIETPKAAGQ
jgi:hypothetical protein